MIIFAVDTVIKYIMAKRIVLAFDIIDENNNSIIEKQQANSIMTPLLANDITREDIMNIELELLYFLINAQGNDQVGHLFYSLKELPQEEPSNSKWTESSPRPFAYPMKHIEFPR